MGKSGTEEYLEMEKEAVMAANLEGGRKNF